jgi:AraC-like DNA-binding protein/mannose-6-phosphate isomerase-like protein (cupin superfamily)
MLLLYYEKNKSNSQKFEWYGQKLRIMLKYEKQRSEQFEYLYHQNDINLKFVKHIHKSFEYIYVYEGSIELELENTIYIINAGQGALILPFQAHSYRTLDYSKTYLCVFAISFATSFFEKYKKKKVIDPVFDFKEHENINQEIQQTNIDRYLLKSYFYLIISNYVKGAKIVLDDNANNELVVKIIEYIEDNIQESITLKDIAKNLGYSYHYLSSLFKRDFKIGFSNLINEYRINNACQLLTDTDMSISNIAQEVGYTSLRNFNRAFTQITNTIPTLFRLQKK